MYICLDGTVTAKAAVQWLREYTVGESCCQAESASHLGGGLHRHHAGAKPVPDLQTAICLRAGTAAGSCPASGIVC